jgi:YceI-like domain
MSSSHAAPGPFLDDLRAGEWRLDRARSSVEFGVPHFWGLVTVKGHFDRYQGTLDLQAEPAVRLTIEADSLDARVRPVEGGIWIEAVTHVFHRELGMMWSPFGITRSYGRLGVRGHLVSGGIGGRRESCEQR